jgi:hypothetical protein
MSEIQAEQTQAKEPPIFPNPLQGEIVLKTKERSFLLRLGMAELAKIEKALDVESFVEVFEMFQDLDEKKPSVSRMWTALSTIVQVGMRRHYPEMSEPEIEDLAFELGVTGLIRAITEAVSRINQDAKEATKLTEKAEGSDPNASAATEVSATS